MLTHPTIDKLRALRLPAFAEAAQQQLGNPEFTALRFEDRLGLLVDAEWTQREQRKLRRRLRQANLRRQASLEDIDWQLGGPNVLPNLWPLDRGENRSSGSLIAKMSFKKPDGSEITMKRLKERVEKEGEETWMIIVRTKG